MKKIEWKNDGSITGIEAKVGNMILRCHSFDHDDWMAEVSINDIASTVRDGPQRKNREKAKEDAIRLAREIQMDQYAAIVEEMKRFGTEIEDG